MNSFFERVNVCINKNNRILRTIIKILILFYRPKKNILKYTRGYNFVRVILIH